MRSKRLAELELASERDLRDIWSWNVKVPDTVEACLHDLIAETVQIQPDAEAVCAWDCSLTYYGLDGLSTRLARCQVGLGVRPDRIMPLCFEKSKWTPVTMLAVMKAGGASVAVDPSRPEERLRAIVRQVEPALVLSSSEDLAVARCLTEESVKVAAVDEAHIAELELALG